ncbi:MAG: hypothetical protein MUP08_02250 [Desulfobulbaceae bacterium]|nr:hypothetical protein [Desulfobulbaceae bacterium]
MKQYVEGVSYFCQRHSRDTQRKLAVKLNREVSEKEGINLKKMQSGSRQGKSLSI